jgi:hypothetical protein
MKILCVISLYINSRESHLCKYKHVLRTYNQKLVEIKLLLCSPLPRSRRAASLFTLMANSLFACYALEGYLCLVWRRLVHHHDLNTLSMIHAYALSAAAAGFLQGKNIIAIVYSIRSHDQRLVLWI